MGNQGGQKNKPHKHGKHNSKSDRKEAAKGRVAIMAGISTKRTATSVKGGLDKGARERRQQIGAHRMATKREDSMWARRLGKKGAPKTVGFIPLGEVASQHLCRQQLQAVCDSPDVPTTGVQTVRSQRFHTNLQFASATDSQQEQLDLAKACDILVIAIRVNTEDGDGAELEPDLPDDTKTINTWYSDVGLCIDDLGRQLVSSINCQGLPSVCVVLQGLSLIPNARKRKQVERVHLRYFQSIMTSDVVPKVFCCDTPDRAILALRYISEQRLRTLKWRDVRPYFLADKVAWERPAEAPVPSETDGAPCKNLAVSGYLRGKGLSANQLVHLTNYGTYQVLSITNERGGVLSTPDPENQESLQYCQVPDLTENEQNVTEEEWKEAERREAEKKKKGGKKRLQVKVPAGFSSYQAAWVADPAEFEEVSEDEDEEAMDPSPAFDTKSRATTRHSRVSTAQQTDVEEVMGGDWLAEDEAKTFEERQAELERLKEMSAEDRDYPDEVETPMHIPSRIRFAKYRGLPSFKNSEWDPNAGLPIDYARIFKFQDFKRTAKIAHTTPEGAVAEAGQYVTVVLKAVPLCFLEEWEQRREAPLLVSGLLKHEQKYSVLHFIMQRNKEYDEPIKSKTRLVVQLGFRKVVANPVYSDVSKGMRTKFARYFHADDRFIMMSMYGPTSFRPTPALCFQPVTRKEKEAGAEMPFVSFGAAQDPNPDMLLLKKIVLTGHVFKTHKRQCIVRFLFHNEEDVKYFQPCELYTKMGFRGRILKSVGTHGHMKATFSGIVQGHDVVCMDLWKRVFPKWTTAAYSHLAAEAQDETSDEGSEGEPDEAGDVDMEE